MDIARRLPWIGIKSKLRQVVKTAGFTLLAAMASSGASASSRNSQFQDTDTVPAPVRDKDLPNIEARSYEVRAAKKSASTRAYLFDDPTNAKPMVGRIILIKKESDPIMALRVLRNFPEKKQFIAKRVRRYGNHESLTEGESLTALERINEIPLPGSMAYSADDVQDIRDLTSGTGLEDPSPFPVPRGVPDFFRSDDLPIPLPSSSPNPVPEPALSNAPPLQPEARTPAEEPLPKTDEYDAELDTGSSPAPDGTAADASERTVSHESDDDAVDPSAVQIEEVEPIDIHRHAVSVQFGFLKNLTAAGLPTNYAGAGIRYGFTLGKMLLLSKPKLQDAFAIEAGIFSYRINGYIDPNDSFSVVPIVVTARYTIHTSESFALFFYGGVMQNRVSISGAALPSSDASLATLQTPVTAGGGGMIFRLGPGWEARADIGMDMIAMGLVLRF